jgi:hypothetical protein
MKIAREYSGNARIFEALGSGVPKDPEEFLGSNAWVAEAVSDWPGLIKFFFGFLFAMTNINWARKEPLSVDRKSGGDFGVAPASHCRSFATDGKTVYLQSPPLKKRNSGACVLKARKPRVFAERNPEIERNEQLSPELAMAKWIISCNLIRNEALSAASTLKLCSLQRLHLH